MSLLGDAFDVLKSGAGAVVGGVKSGVKVIAGAAQDVWATFGSAAGAVEKWAGSSSGTTGQISTASGSGSSGGGLGLPAIGNIASTRIAGVPLWVLAVGVGVLLYLKRR